RVEVNDQRVQLMILLPPAVVCRDGGLRGGASLRKLGIGSGKSVRVACHDDVLRIGLKSATLAAFRRSSCRRRGRSSTAAREGRGRSAAEDPSTAFLLREEWRRSWRRQGKKAARRVALCTRLWPDRRFERPRSRRPDRSFA